MSQPAPRGIAVADLGSTNTKLALFSADGEMVAERKTASCHHAGPPYGWIDAEPVFTFLAEAIADLDRTLPIDVIVPCSHGASLACLDGGGKLALPIMDYATEPPVEVIAEYRAIMPPFAECFCGLLPMALLHGLQLYWQQRDWPEDFARIRTIIPYMQYAGFRLGGRAVTEITAMSAQSHLVDVAKGGLSSLVKARGWATLFPPLAPAWADIGALSPTFGGGRLRGRGRIRAGLHDSSANFVRYLAGGFRHFTLLSTGTWSISFDPDSDLRSLREDLDTCTNTNIFGRPVATSRFYGGKEFELLTRGATAAPRMDLADGLVARGSFALPAFSASAGPMPGTAGRGRLVGPAPDSPAALATLASLYCALMVAEQLDAVGSRHDIIVDGPFATNDVLLALLAQLRPGQRVLASSLRDGTTAGAACVGLMQDAELPHVALTTVPVAAARVPGLAEYQRQWRRMAHDNAG
jgi:sugar (pentulose or hexulose) kinase